MQEFTALFASCNGLQPSLPQASDGRPGRQHSNRLSRELGDPGKARCLVESQSFDIQQGVVGFHGKNSQCV
jgi:hypothetical protein